MATQATQTLPPRPLASDADAPPSVALPWATALIAWVCVSIVVLVTAALHPGSMPAVSGRGLSGVMEWLCHLAMHTLPALLLPLGASGVDRILPRWPRLMRWTVAMGVAGGVGIPLARLLFLHFLPTVMSHAPNSPVAASLVGLCGGALLGLIIGSVARLRRGRRPVRLGPVQ